MDILKYAKKCEAVEFIILFDLVKSGRFIRMEGYEDIPIWDGQLFIKFCTGECDATPNQAFLYAAFSVVKLGESHGTGMIEGEEAFAWNKCDKIKEVCECKKSKCEYNAVTKTCVNTPESKCY